MTPIGWAQIALVLSLVFLASVPLGQYMAAVLQGRRTPAQPGAGPDRAWFLPRSPASTSGAK